MADYHKHQWIWWDINKSKNRPKWIPKDRDSQAGEIVDVESDHAVIAILNEGRVVETYMVPVDQIRPRG
jgi:hypothetical protein